MEKTSIIILAYKEPKKFKKMFETLLKHTHQKETPYEIIVLDNHAEKEIKEYLGSQEDNITTLITMPKNIGVTKGYNYAVGNSHGHYLCFFNSDYYMVDGWLKSMIKCFKHQKGIGMISCATNFTGNPDERTECIVNGNELSVDLKDDYKESKYPIAQMFMTKKVYDEVGGFDEHYFVSVLDLDMGEQVRRKGYKTFVNRKTFGFHDFDFEKLPGLSELDKKYQKYFLEKWGKRIWE